MRNTFLFLSGLLIALPVAAQSDSLLLEIGVPAERKGLPVLFLMDPRGRAMVPLELFRAAAERHGYVLMSSHESLSDADSAFAVNAKSLSAMIVDAQVRFGVDPSRFYLVGFSGTAHFAWTAAAQLDGHVAGIVSVGGGLPVYEPSVQAALQAERPFAFFATAGRADFNYDAVRLTDRALDTTRLAHRFTAFDGPHGWPPREIAFDAVEWLELRAMQTSLIARNDAWFDSLCAAYLQEARRLEEADRPVDAARRHRETDRDCAGTRAGSRAKERYDALSDSRAVRRIERRRDELARDVFNYKLAVRDFAGSYGRVRHDRAVRELRIGELKKQARDASNADAADAARRMLASAYATTAFYEPRAYLEAEAYGPAAGMLRIALEIRPKAPVACYWLARAAAQLGRTDKAFEALDCAVEGGIVRSAELTTDRLLAPLAGSERWRTLIRTVEQSNQ